eukprot:6200058-Pleurochrysis_carterae.AAC.3
MGVNEEVRARAARSRRAGAVVRSFVLAVPELQGICHFNESAPSTPNLFAPLSRSPPRSLARWRRALLLF